MKNNKSPGSSGYTPLFLKKILLSHFAVSAINYAFKSGELSLSQYLGIITCLPNPLETNLEIYLKLLETFITNKYYI